MPPKRKERVTSKEIKHDLGDIIIHGKSNQKSKYEKLMIVSFVLMIAMAYAAAIWHIYVLYAVFALIPILVVLPAVEAVLKTRKAENISLDDYSRRESNSCRFQRGIFTPAVVTFPCNTAV